MCKHCSVMRILIVQSERLLITLDASVVAHVCTILVLMSRSGHRSDAIHCYKRPSFEQEMSVSKTLDVPDFASAGGYSDVKRHCTNAENRLCRIKISIILRSR